MVKLLKRVRYLCIRKTRGQRVDYKGTTNAGSQRHSNKISSLTERRQYLSETDDQTLWRRVDDRLEAGYRGAKAIPERRSQDGGNNGTTWGVSPKESVEMQMRH